jgi:hypothetical protein
MKLAAAKRLVEKNLVTGIQCPCCGQFAKVYKRTITSSMAYCLVTFANKTKNEPDKFMHIRDLGTNLRTAHFFGSGDFAKLLYWDLIATTSNNDTAKRSSGVWCITQRGVDFVADKITVPKHALLYDGKLIGLTGKQINIVAALGKKFHYKDLMNNML